MAVTRHSTGSSRPRVFPVVDTAPVTVRKKSTATTTKKPRSIGSTAAKSRGKKATATSSTATTAAGKKTATGRVTKKVATGTGAKKQRRQPTLVDKVQGTVKKIEGAITGRPGKKAAGTAQIRGHDGKKKTTAKKA